jgi:ferritin-like metal-binding protein YciE
MQSAPGAFVHRADGSGGTLVAEGTRGGAERARRLRKAPWQIPAKPEPIKLMSKLTSLNVLLVQEIKDLYSAENQLVKALPKMAKAATDAALKAGFKAHLEETKVHAERLDQIATILGVSPKGKACNAMKGLVEEGAETIEEEGDPVIKDLALIAAAQRVEHYEISGYGTARAIAETLKLDDVVDLLQLTLEEESAADLILTRLAERLLPAAMGETADA